MGLVRTVPDQSMMESGHELRTFERLSFLGGEHRLVIREIETLPSERMPLPLKEEQAAEVTSAALTYEE
jgi:hypothetical protein